MGTSWGCHGDIMGTSWEFQWAYQWAYHGDKGLEAIANVDAYVETIDENGNIMCNYASMQIIPIDNVIKFPM